MIPEAGNANWTRRGMRYVACPPPKLSPIMLGMFAPPTPKPVAAAKDERPGPEVFAAGWFSAGAARSAFVPRSDGIGDVPSEGVPLDGAVGPDGSGLGSDERSGAAIGVGSYHISGGDGSGHGHAFWQIGQVQRPQRHDRAETGFATKLSLGAANVRRGSKAGATHAKHRANRARSMQSERRLNLTMATIPVKREPTRSLVYREPASKLTAVSAGNIVMNAVIGRAWSPHESRVERIATLDCNAHTFRRSNSKFPRRL